MPTYNFKCKLCGETFQRQLHFDDDTQSVRCPNGHNAAQRVYSSAPTVVFKGSGFYVTDNGSGSKNGKSGN